MKVIVPLRTGAGQNDREHWRARTRRVKAERYAVAWMLALHKPPAGPVTVLLTRVAPGNGLDAHDNLRGSLKAPVDQVAQWLGRDDRDPSITWEYAQRRGKHGEWLVGIEIEAAADQVGDAGHVDGRANEGGMFGVEVILGCATSDAAVAIHDSNDADPSVAHTLSGGEKRVPANMVKRQHGLSVAQAGQAFKRAGR